MDYWFENIKPIKIPRSKRIDNFILKKCECCFFVNRQLLERRLLSRTIQQRFFDRNESSIISQLDGYSLETY